MLNLKEVAGEITSRLARIFLPREDGCSAWQSAARYSQDPLWRELVQFHEYFHAGTGRGLGASHRTGWTALVLPCLEAGATIDDTHHSSPSDIIWIDGQAHQDR